MVSLNDLDIDLITQYAGSNIEKLETQIDACADIRGHASRNTTRAGDQLCLLLRCKTGGANHYAATGSTTDAGIGQRGQRHAEIDQHIKMMGYRRQVAADDHAASTNTRQLAGIDTNQRTLRPLQRRRQAATLRLVNGLDQRFTHASAGAGHCNTQCHTNPQNARFAWGVVSGAPTVIHHLIKISRLRFNALTCIDTIGGEKVLFLKPQTYMNLSGNAVAPAAAFYKLPPERILVVCDDISLPAGKLRLRSKGSSGGHNGLKSIISALGTENFPRIKVGVGSPDTQGDENAVINWVLGTLCGKDAELVDHALNSAADAVSSVICEGMDTAMNKFN